MKNFNRPPITEREIIRFGDQLDTYNMLGVAKPDTTIEQFILPQEREYRFPTGPITEAEIALQGIQLRNQEAEAEPDSYTPPTEAEVTFLGELLKKIDDIDNK